MTFAGLRSRGFSESQAEWAFEFIRVPGDTDPGINRILLRQGLLRFAREQGVNYIEFTVNNLPELLPAARAAEVKRHRHT